MPVESRHPQYNKLVEVNWRLIQDSVGGEGHIKARGEVYLPKPNGYNLAEDGGQDLYNAYRLRAQFPEILAPTASAMIGVIHAKKIEITLTPTLEYLRESCTKSGLTLDSFHRRITSNLLKSGRYGVLVDAPKDGGDPFLCGYSGENLINWDDIGGFYVLDDSGPVRKEYDWENQNAYLVLRNDGGSYSQKQVVDGTETELTPTMTGGKAIPRIPFVVGNAVEVSPDIVTPPLIGVSRSSIAMYQLSADYRWQLFMSGQETLVAIDGEKPTMVGAGVVHEMRGDGENAPDLKYVSPTCAGIDAHKIAISDNRDDAVMSGAKFLKQESGTGNESGKSRKMRFASETATLSSVANVSCEILEQSLRNAAMLLGLSDEQQKEITVTPPADLMDNTLTSEDVVKLVNGWMNDGYSYETLYENLQKGGIASPDRTVDEELGLISGEAGDSDLENAA